MDLRACTRAAPIQQSTRLDLQPHKHWSGYARHGFTPSLALRLSVHAERPRLRCRVGHGRWLALSAAPPDGLARCNKDVLVLHRRSFRQTNAPRLAASAFQHKIQRTSTRRLFFRSGCRALIDPYGMGHTQTHAALLADLDFWRLRQSAHLALLANVG